MHWYLKIAIALVAAFIASCVSAPESRDEVTISIVGLNDVHGALNPTARHGGLVTVSAYVNALRQARDSDDGAVLVIDAGDMWQGTLESNLSEGAFMVAAYNTIQVTAAAIGNHEFDFGPIGERAIPIEQGDNPRGALQQRAREAQFPLLAANLIDSANGEPVQWDNVQPSVMIEAAGVDVGIIGVLTSRTLATTMAANTVGLEIAPLAPTIAAEARQLRAAGADLVVVAAHAGGKCEDFSDAHDLSSCDMSGEIMRVASALEPGLVDHIIGGHNHNPIAHIVNGISITANRSSAYSFGRVDFRVDREDNRVVSRRVFPPQHTAQGVVGEYEGYPLVPDPGLLPITTEAQAASEELKRQELGVVLTGPFELEPDIESPLSNLMTRAMYESFDADIAIHNVFGGIRRGLPAGKLTYGDVYQMFPFDNVVAIHEISGRDLRAVVASKALVHRKFGFAGMRVFVGCSDGVMTVDMRLEDGRVIADDDRVRVLANDFLILGGDDILTLAIPDGGFDLRYDLPRTRDTLIEWFRSGPATLDPETFRSNSLPRWNVPDASPADCRF
jgi:5'-nucleotidase